MSKVSELNALYTRDSGVCWICHRVTPRDYATRDHLIPRSKGGPDNVNNYAIACYGCNHRRGSMDMLSDAAIEEIISNVQGGRCHSCDNSATLVNFRRVSGFEGSRTILRGFCVECKNVEVIPKQRFHRESISPTMPITSVRRGQTIKFDIGSVHCGVVANVRMEKHYVMALLDNHEKEFMIPIKRWVELVK